MKGMRLIKGVLRTPRKFHIGRCDGFFIRWQNRAGGNESERLLPGPVLDRVHIPSMRQQEVLIQIGMAEVDAIEVNIKLLQIFTQRKNSRGRDSRTALSRCSNCMHAGNSPAKKNRANEPSTIRFHIPHHLSLMNCNPFPLSVSLESYTPFTLWPMTSTVWRDNDGKYYSA